MNGLSIRDDGVKRLAAYLKAQPGGAKRPPAELAREFGLETAFVAQVLRGLRRPSGVSVAPVFRRLGGAIRHVVSGGIEAVKGHATAIVVLTLYAAGTAFAMTTQSTTQAGTLTVPELEQLRHHGLRLLGETLALDCLLFFLSSNPRAVLGAVANLGLILLAEAALITLRSTRAVANGVGLDPLSIGLLCAGFAAVGALAAGIGALWRLERQDEIEVTLSRQQLLERLFEIEGRLATAKDEGRRTRSLLPRWLMRPFKMWPLGMAAALGVAVGGCQLLLGAEAATERVPSLLLLLVILLAGVAYFIGAFVSENFWEGLKRNVLLYLVSTVLALAPLNGFGPDYFHSGDFFVNRRAIFFFVLVLTSLGFLMNRLEERLSVQARLDAGDPAALLAEIVRIEWLLSARHQEVVVLSVDVARSTEMKANCDPLVAEYSFREYQDFIRLICNAAGGFVHSTAGDGAILAFPTAEKAFQAAREIQTGVSYFNEHVNKMPSKFRLRIGLHMGETADDLRQVEYTEVIDIAAHVQEVAPIRGIVVTKPVAAHLPNEHLIPLREPVEGFEVFLAYNPTVDM